MKLLLGLATVAAVIALAVIIGQRMSNDAMAVALGVVFGVAASIPTSLLVVAATRGRRDEQATYRRYADPPPPSPPPQIYVVNPGNQPASWLGQGGGQPQLPQPPAGYFSGRPARRYKVVGEDDAWLDDDDWD
jgi:hypothetical protein